MFFQEAAWQQKGWSANFRLLIPDIEGEIDAIISNVSSESQILRKDTLV